MTFCVDRRIKQAGGEPTSIEAKEALVAQHLLSTVKAVLVHQLANKGSGGPLILHTSLYQINGVHSCCPRGY